jgi:hypothetical protein
MRTAEVFFFAVILAIGGTSVVTAQPPSSGTAPYTQYGEPPVMDNTIFYHLLLDQLEGRTNGPDNEFRWDGEGWIGTDMNKLWFKSEGFVEHGRMTDGDQEVLYDRPIPYLRYFDLQAGVRYDLDSDLVEHGVRSESRGWRPTSSNLHRPSTSAIEVSSAAGSKVHMTS